MTSLYQINRRTVANMRRSSWWRRWKASEQATPEVAFSDELDRELELEIRRCLALVPRNQAEVLMLVDIEGFTRSEVARLLGLSEGTVASRLRLGRAAFRGHWDPAVAGEEPAGERSGPALASCRSRP